MNFFQRNRKAVVSAVIAGTAILVLGWLAFYRGAKGDPGQTPTAAGTSVPTPAGIPSSGPLGITYAIAHTGTVDALLKLAGTVSVPSSQTATVSPRVQGQVVSVLARVGDQVAAGQTLARIRSLDIATAQAAVTQAQTQVKYTKLVLDHQRQLAHLGSFSQVPMETARSAVNTAQAALEGDRSGYDQDVLTIQQDQAAMQQDQSVVGQDQSVVLQDQSQQNQDELDLEHDNLALDRQRQLYQNGIVAKQDLETAQTTEDKDKEKIAGDKLKVDGDRVKVDGDTVKVHGDQEKVQSDQVKVEGDKMHLKTDEVQVRIAKAALDRETHAFNANIYTSQNVEQAQSTYYTALQQLQAAQDTLRIHGVGGDSSGMVDVPAPIGGIVAARNVNPGMNVDTSTLTPWQMFTITNPSLVYVDSSVNDTDLARVRVGMPVTVSSPAYPNVRYTARVTYIMPAIDASSHTAKVRCALENRDDALKDGMYVDTWIATAPASALVMVPSTAIGSDQTGKFVFLPKPGDGFQKQKVETGNDVNTETEVLSGLTPGQKVVADGSLLLQNELANGDD